jgi:hypothetical protein
VHHVIASLIIGDHDVTPVSDQTMERHQSRTIAPKPVRRGFLSDRDWDKCAEIISADAWFAAAMNSGPSPREGGGVEASARDSMEESVTHRSLAMGDQLQAIRRRLWILSATLESLSAKIELAIRKKSEVAGGDGPGRLRHSPDAPYDERLALPSAGFVASWWARRRLARLRSRADRADRRAAVAINDASASFSAVLGAVLEAAIARVKADEACLSSCSAPGPRVCDRPSPDAPGTMQGLGISPVSQRQQVR